MGASESAGPTGDNAEVSEAGPALTVSAVARRLGVAPATLRTWDRRYGVGPSDHSAGSHRRYSPADVQRLQRMRQLTLDGVTPAEAARVALAGAANSVSAPPAVKGPPPVRGSGGRVVALPGADPEVRGLARAAMALDSPAAHRIVADQLARYGTCWTWENLLQPVLIALGERWEATGTGVDVEHVFSGVVSAALQAVRRETPDPINSRPVLLATAAREEHTLPIQVLASALAERGVAARLLGGRVPPDALGDAVRRSGASAVFLWAHQPGVIAADQLAQIPVTRPPTSVVVGGAGWSTTPPGAAMVDSLVEAVEVLTRSALG